jgi:hypothetical protein
MPISHIENTKISTLLDGEQLEPGNDFGQQSQNPIQPSEVPPAVALMQMMTGVWLTQSIHVAASLGIADLLTEGTRSVDELAQTVGAQTSHLYRVLRALASFGIFTEVASRHFALTEMAEYLRSDIPGSLRPLSMTMSDEWQWNCWGDLLNIVKTGQPAMQKLYQVDDTFEYLTQKNPQAGALFDKAMIGWCSAIHLAVLNTYDFSGIHRLVDVAGGHGTLLASILQKYPHLQGVLFDLPQVVAGAGTLLENRGVADRCQVVGGSFFGQIPVGGDAYILSHIVHDWGDEDCIKFLSNIRQAIAPNGKLIIVEMVIPAGDAPHFGKLLDVEMMAIFSGGRERTEAEYHQLFEASGFRLTRIVPTASPVSVIEGVCA